MFLYSSVTGSALRQAGVTPSSIPHAGTREQLYGSLHTDQVLQRLTLLARGESWVVFCGKQGILFCVLPFSLV